MAADASSGVAPHLVAIGLGSNRRHVRHGAPRQVVLAAAAFLAANGLDPLGQSRVIETAPMGPRQRRFANAVMLGCWHGTPASLLVLLKATERAFGRRAVRRWGPRVLDCDLLLYG
ncbi:MAG: 2-amino-4-hydroxy-6-hydroxymethyldihydropteridine diphosphokinase, partial [Sphingomonadaceae bacterium]